MNSGVISPNGVVPEKPASSPSVTSLEALPHSASAAAGASVPSVAASVVSVAASVVTGSASVAAGASAAGRGVVVAAAGCGNESQADQQCTDALHA